MTSETQLSRQVQVALESIGCVVVRVNSGQLRGSGGHVVKLAKAGTPDLWFAFQGRQGWIELKADWRVTEEQVAWHERARKQGVFVVVVRSVEQALRVVTGRAA